MSDLTQPIKWHGGKSYLARRILALAPPRCKNPNAPAADDPGYLHYVEPYAGGLSVLLENDPEGISEVVNDINHELINFWQVLAHETCFSQFIRFVDAVPFSEWEWKFSATAVTETDAVQRAIAFFIRCRQSLAGRMDSFAPLSKSRTRRGINEQASAWIGAVDGLPAVHARLRRVVILNSDALKVIEQQDGPRTWFYADPPYVHTSRVTTDAYAHEMTEQQHVTLLTVLATIKGRFALSGYRNDLYDLAAIANGWHRTDIEIPNHAAGGKEKRLMIENVWTNYEPVTK